MSVGKKKSNFLKLVDMIKNNTFNKDSYNIILNIFSHYLENPSSYVLKIEDLNELDDLIYDKFIDDIYNLFIQDFKIRDKYDDIITDESIKNNFKNKITTYFNNKDELTIKEQKIINRIFYVYFSNKSFFIDEPLFKLDKGFIDKLLEEENLDEDFYI